MKHSPGYGFEFFVHVYGARRIFGQYGETLLQEPKVKELLDQIRSLSRKANETMARSGMA